MHSDQDGKQVATVLALIDELESNEWSIRDLGPALESQEAQGLVLECVMDGSGLRQVADRLRLKWYGDYYSLEAEVERRVESKAGLGFFAIHNLSVASGEWGQILGPGAPIYQAKQWQPRHNAWPYRLSANEIYEFVKNELEGARRLSEAAARNCHEATSLVQSAICEGFASGKVVALKPARTGYEYMPPEVMVEMDPMTIHEGAGYRMLLTSELPRALQATLQRLLTQTDGGRRGGPLLGKDRKAEADAETHFKRRAENDERYPRKSDAEKDLVSMFGISKSAFKRIWKKHAPPDWKDPGRKRKA